MAGTFLAALAVATGMNMAGPMDTRPMTEIGKLSDAIALTRACPSVRIDTDRVARTLARAGISLAPLMPEIGRQSKAMALRYIHLDRKRACAVARQRYGAGGTAAAGFLAER